MFFLNKREQKWPVLSLESLDDIGAWIRILMSVIPGKMCKRALCVQTAIIFFFRFKLYKPRPVKNSDFFVARAWLCNCAGEKALLLGCKKNPNCVATVRFYNCIYESLLSGKAFSMINYFTDEIT